jgi:aquaporin Z
LYAIANGKPGFVPGRFAANGFGGHSLGRYSLESAILAEGVIAIGLALTLIHLIGIPVTNLSVNPARSSGCSG